MSAPRYCHLCGRTIDAGRFGGTPCQCLPPNVIHPDFEERVEMLPCRHGPRYRIHRGWVYFMLKIADGWCRIRPTEASDFPGYKR